MYFNCRVNLPLLSDGTISNLYGFSNYVTASYYTASNDRMISVQGIGKDLEPICYVMCGCVYVWVL